MPAWGNRASVARCLNFILIHCRIITRSYCDGNAVSGLYCPEMDILEANTAAMQVTPHNCDAPQGHYYPMCDHGGCAINTHKENANGYGPGVRRREGELTA